ncbi:MAG: hypothetical protein AAF658_12085 [Myxococcota bacterium]
MSDATTHRVGVWTRKVDVVELADVLVTQDDDSRSPSTWGVLDGATGATPLSCDMTAFCDGSRVSYSLTDVDVLLGNAGVEATGVELAGSTAASIDLGTVSVRAEQVAIGVRTSELQTATVGSAGSSITVRAVASMGGATPGAFGFVDGTPPGLSGAEASDGLQLSDFQISVIMVGAQPADGFGVYLAGTSNAALSGLDVSTSVSGTARQVVGVQLLTVTGVSINDLSTTTSGNGSISETGGALVDGLGSANAADIAPASSFLTVSNSRFESVMPASDDAVVGCVVFIGSKDSSIVGSDFACQTTNGPLAQVWTLSTQRTVIRSNDFFDFSGTVSGRALAVLDGLSPSMDFPASPPLLQTMDPIQIGSEWGSNVLLVENNIVRSVDSPVTYAGMLFGGTPGGDRRATGNFIQAGSNLTWGIASWGPLEVSFNTILGSDDANVFPGQTGFSVFNATFDAETSFFANIVASDADSGFLPLSISSDFDIGDAQSIVVVLFDRLRHNLLFTTGGPVIRVADNTSTDLDVSELFSAMSRDDVSAVSPNLFVEPMLCSDSFIPALGSPVVDFAELDPRRTNDARGQEIPTGVAPDSGAFERPISMSGCPALPELFD